MIGSRFAVEVYLVGQEEDGDPLATYWFTEGGLAVPAVGEVVTLYPDHDDPGASRPAPARFIVQRRTFGYALSYGHARGECCLSVTPWSADA